MRGRVAVLKRISPVTGGGREQAHDGQRGDGFSGAGFADQAEDFAGGDRE
jgi:hypothetical protein